MRTSKKLDLVIFSTMPKDHRMFWEQDGKFAQAHLKKVGLGNFFEHAERPQNVFENMLGGSRMRTWKKLDLVIISTMPKEHANAIGKISSRDAHFCIYIRLNLS